MYTNSALFGLLGLSIINHTSVVHLGGPQYKTRGSAHTGRLPLGAAYCALYVYNVLVELALTYQTIVALSAKLIKATTTVHTGCHLPI